MPLAASFGAASVRGLGLGNGEVPRAPVITTPASDDTTIATPISLAISYTITISTFPLSHVQYKLEKIDASNNVTDAGNWTGTLPGASGSNSATITTRVNSSGAVENLLHNQKYRIYLRSVDAAGQTGPESTLRRFTTANEVGPTAAAPSPFSSSVSYPTSPSLQFTWSAGTNGTYTIATRQYSVVAGNNPGAGTYTTLSGASGTSSTITTTASGQAIVPGTLYTIYIKYIAASPGTAEAVAYATHTTAAEILPSAPTASISSWNGTNNDTTVGREGGRTSIVVSRGNVPTPPTPTYQYKYQYAYGTSANPTNWADFPTSGQASSVTISGLGTDTTYYARVRAVSLGPSGAAGSVSGNASGITNPAIPPTPTLAWNGMSSSSYGTASFVVGNNGGSTTSVYIFARPYSGSNTSASTYLRGTGAQSISGYTSDGGTLYYVAYNYNRLSENGSPSTQLYWTRPQKNVYYESKPQGTGELVLAATNSSLSGCAASYFGITHSGIPDSDDVPGYKYVNSYGFQLKTGGFSNTATTYLYWTDPAGTKTASLDANAGASYSLRWESLARGGSSLDGEIKINFLWVDGSPTGSAARNANSGFGCLPNGSSWFYAKEFYVEGVQTIGGAVG